MKLLPVTEKGYWATWVSTLLFFAAFYTLLVPLPLYLVEVGLPDWQIGVILGAFAVASLITRPLTGLFADRWGRRSVMLFGAGALLVGATGTSVTTQPFVLFGLRIMQAAGYVAFTTAATALVSDLALPQQRGAALAIFGAAANVAMTLTPAAISISLGLLTIRGALWLSGILAFLSGILILPIRPKPLRDKQRWIWRTLLKVPSELRTPMMIAGLFGLGFGAFLQFLPLLTERRGLGPAGLVYTAYGVGIILTRLTMGRRLDQGDRNKILFLAFLLMTMGLVGFAFADSLGLLLGASIFIAVGSGILHPSLIAIHVERMPESEHGRATANFYISFDLGIGLGAWVLAMVLQLFGLMGLYLFAAASAIIGVPLVRQLK